MKKILYKLTGGDLRSKGKSEEVVQIIINNPKQFKDIFEGMLLAI